MSAAFTIHIAAFTIHINVAERPIVTRTSNESETERPTLDELRARLQQRPTVTPTVKPQKRSALSVTGNSRH
jgi:hypothetical protein